MPSLYREGTPPALKRCWKWYLVGMGAHMTIMVLGAGGSLMLGGLLPMALFGALSVGLMVAGMAVSLTITLRIRTHVRRLRGRACPTCLYDLSASPQAGHCPECGTPYTMAEVVRQWRNADQSYRARKLYTPDE